MKQKKLKLQKIKALLDIAPTKEIQHEREVFRDIIEDIQQRDLAEEKSVKLEVITEVMTALMEIL